MAKQSDGGKKAGGGSDPFAKHLKSADTARAVRNRLVTKCCREHDMTREEATELVDQLDDGQIHEALESAAAEHEHRQPVGADADGNKPSAFGAEPVGGKALDFILQIVNSPIGQLAIAKLLALLGLGSAGVGGVDRARVGSEHGGTAPHGQGTVDPATGQTTTPGGQEPGNPGPDADPNRA